MYDLSNVFPGYEIGKKIGNGSYGTVYRASEAGSDEKNKFAVKVVSFPADFSEIKKLKSEGKTNDEIRIYFRECVEKIVEELKTVRDLPNISSVKECKWIEAKSELNWDIYILYDMLTPLNKSLYGKKFTEEEVARMGAEVCTALEVGESNGVVHRCVKPENIFINSYGSFVLGDFGMAKILEEGGGGFRTGNLNYTAPEVASEKEYDGRADIYSLGLVMYRLMNKNFLPFLTEDSMGDANEKEKALDRRLKVKIFPPLAKHRMEWQKLLQKLARSM